MEQIVFFFFIFGDLFFLCQEYIDSMLMWSSYKQLQQVQIVDFKETQGTVFECRYYCVVEVDSEQYLIRRRVRDKLGRKVWVFISNNINNYFRMPICYRKSLEMIYLDLIQVIWQMTILPLSIYGLLSNV